jgi:hypothetical protein
MQSNGRQYLLKFFRAESRGLRRFLRPGARRRREERNDHEHNQKARSDFTFHFNLSFLTRI